MKLIEVWTADVNKSYDLYSSFDANENGFENPTYGMDFDQYKQYVDLCLAHSKGEKLRPGYVPDTKYILVDDNDNYVGIYNFRHYLNDFLRNGAGHIGYGIRKEYRGHGYAAIGLKMLLNICKEKGLDEVLLSVDKTNPASLKTQLNCGATIYREDEDTFYTKIKI